MDPIKIIECPRDAMQGLARFIPTEKKIRYLNILLQTGFDTLDFGSFVSPAVIPQMADTAEVLKGLRPGEKTKLLAIVANLRGVQEALKFSEITYLGYPFSISETFQRRNTNKGIKEALEDVSKMLELVDRSDKKAVLYLSMAFGNPYGDEWSEEIAGYWLSQLAGRGASIVSLSDTIGAASENLIENMFSRISTDFPQLEIGLHLHSPPATAAAKIEAAYRCGCRRFDSALRGYGGCPMAKDELTGNIATEALIDILENHQESLELNHEKLREALEFSEVIFS